MTPSRPSRRPRGTRRRAPTTLLLLAGLLASACGSPAPEAPGGTEAPAVAAGASAEASRSGGPAIFVDVAEASGLRFEHDNGRSGELYFVEPVGAGAALADFDGDG
ncbi:MAG: hypothetical protein KDD11_10550, partial [Acidobacteria bacterium]|nr:hypothetical protein [Acidobacteriota bacterium]